MDQNPFSSSNGTTLPSQNSASNVDGDVYDSDDSYFVPPTSSRLSMSLPAELAGAIPLIDRFQVENFLRAMQKQVNSAGKRVFFSRKSIGPAVNEKFTLEDMLCFQKDAIPTSLLKINSDLVSRSVKIFQMILKYMGIDSSDKLILSLDERIELIAKLYKQTLNRSELRDEFFVQISKQTRNNPDRSCLVKAWELMYLFSSSMPPSKDIAAYVSEYVHNVVQGAKTDPEVQILALNTLNSLERSVKAGPRLTIPAREEIEALLIGKKLTTIVFFLDETFEEITYDMTTTVGDAVQELASIIKLSTYSSFSLFECRKVVQCPKSIDSGNEEFIGLDDNKYIGDLLTEFKALKDRSKGEILHCKLTFKKRLFRESDEAVTDLIFVQLSFVQLQHDYVLGNYPVGRDDAAQLSALQILSEIGFVRNPETCIEWISLLERFLPRQIAITRAKREWELDILSRYNLLEQLSKDDARKQFLRILRTLPYGNSVFFSLRKIDDPIGLLPGLINLGINKRGVHFFRPVPKEYLHSSELRDIMQFGSSNTAVFFKMRVAGVLHIFQFETKQGEEICVVLQTHINDVMLRRYSKARSVAVGSPQEDLTCHVNSSGLDNYAKRVLELTKAVEESHKNADKGMVSIENVSMLQVSSFEDLMAVILRGSEQRHVAGTQMNDESSRSHLILSIIIESTNRQTQTCARGKLSFVDLAGSERIKKSGSWGNQLKEAQSINKSLSAIGDVISALCSEGQHIPYRNHKLTMLMSDSLGGNAKTLMFVNASPAETNLEETYNSLTYASRVRCVVNDPSRNVSSKEIARLRKLVSYWKELAGKRGDDELEEIQEERQSRDRKDIIEERYARETNDRRNST